MPRKLPSPLIKLDVPPKDKESVIRLMELDGYVVDTREQADKNFTIIGTLP